MALYDQAAWAVIIGLALLMVGSLVIWAYGRARTTPLQVLATLNGPEAEATRLLHTRLVRLFMIYGLIASSGGIALTLWGGSLLLK